MELEIFNSVLWKMGHFQMSADLMELWKLEMVLNEVAEAGDASNSMFRTTINTHASDQTLASFR